jgi:hypothetical protein
VQRGSVGDFENPGGMWMPSQMENHADILRSLGVEDPDSLTDIRSHPLGAVVWMGGCSASFVSPEGLIITNHHCAISSLQFNSTPGRNLLEDGFLAESKSDEVPMMTGGKVWVALDFEDITDRMTEGLADIEDDLDRAKEIEKRSKGILAECEHLEGIRCRIGKYFGGGLYYLIRQLEISDVRLVYAPPKSIGYYGGDTDNWQWPRHTGDFSFFRAYVAPDGTPAEHSEENVPFKPEHYLRVASEPLGKGDYVMVAGYPGRTSRLKTADEVQFAINISHPRSIYLMEKLVERLKDISEKSEDLKIKASRSIFGLMNSLKYHRSLQEGLKELDFADAKRKEQESLEEWIASDAKRLSKWGGVLGEIERLNEQSRRNYLRDNMVWSLLRNVKMLSSAHTIVRMAEERGKPDADRDPEYQERNWDRMIQSQQRMQKSYDRQIDVAMLRFHLEEISRLPEAERKQLSRIIAGSKDFKGEGIEKIIGGLYNDELMLEDVNDRVELFSNASLKELRKSDDPMIRLAIGLRRLTKKTDDEDKAYAGAMVLLRPGYVEALKAFKGSFLSDDANGTLRVTYGTVRGYKPRPGAEEYEPFTKLPELLEKDTGDEPFNSPQRLLEAAKAKRYGPYKSKEIDELPLNFLSDTDITGGNSGSATMNSRGELVGLAFDGNSEALASDWVFLPDISRTIHVDIRYVLWIMDYVDGAHWLLREMGIEPASK